MATYPYYPNYMQPQQNYAYPQQVQAQYPNNAQNVLVRVQSENDARMYPVAPGASVIFTDENAPYIYVKSVNMSQLDRPQFERYRLVKEETQLNAVQESQTPSFDPKDYVTKEEFLQWATKIKDSIMKKEGDLDVE